MLDGHGKLCFHCIVAPYVDELKALGLAISHRVAGFLERDAENRYLALKPDDDDAMVQLQGRFITYRIAVSPQQGPKVFTLQTPPPHKLHKPNGCKGSSRASCRPAPIDPGNGSCVPIPDLLIFRFYLLQPTCCLTLSQPYQISHA